jgi:hypothetical protein
MGDFELLERYFRQELSEEEVEAFNYRLSTDTAFKELYNTELLVAKAALFAREKNRITSLAAVPEKNPEVAKSLVWNLTLWQAAVTATIIWFITNVAFGIFQLDPSFIKGIGLFLACTISIAFVLYYERRFKLQMVFFSVLNGLIFFIMASGLDAINQGINLPSSKSSKAVLVPFTQNAVWWPTQSLIDSVEHQKQINREITTHYLETTKVLQSNVDSCLGATYDFIPIVRPKSSVVAAGALYQADMLLAVAASPSLPDMFYNGKSIPIEIDSITGAKIGKVKFKANAPNFDAQGNAKQSFKAEIRLKDEVYDQIIEYIVTKPTIRVTTGALPRLYMGCGNDVNIDVPSLGTEYNPSYKVTGGEYISGSKKGNVIIIPTQRKVTVEVSSSGTFIGNETFDVENVPRPRIVAKDNTGRNIDLKNGIKAGQVLGLLINAESEENFKNVVPKDAHYRVLMMNVILARGTARVAEKTVTSELVDISDWRTQMRPGDRISIEPRGVVRMTFKGTLERVSISGQDIINIPVN